VLAAMFGNLVLAVRVHRHVGTVFRSFSHSWDDSTIDR
jgi:hypothetical protein